MWIVLFYYGSANVSMSPPASFFPSSLSDVAQMGKVAAVTISDVEIKIGWS